jgi:hypothetical protein
MKYKTLLVFFFLSVFSCSNLKKNNHPQTSGILTDRTGLDGCSWVIKLAEKLPDGTQFLEPVNLAEFVQQPREGQSIKFTYDKVSAMSICMIGTSVKLTSLQ